MARARGAAAVVRVRRAPGRRTAVDPDTEYLLWQTLVGAWPISQERLTGYLTKAIREAKRRTSWTDSDPGYEAAVLGLASRVLSDASLRGSIEAFVASIAADALANSLGAKLVQLTMPGVPDVYQGCELAGLSLVDPDNRRPVDYGRRQSLLADLDAGRLDAASSPDPDPDPVARLDAAKLLVTSRALRLRRDHPDWFAGSYEPLTAAGDAAGHAVAFARGGHADHGGHPAARRPPPAGRLGRHATGTACSRGRRRLGGRAHRGRVPGRERAARGPDSAAAGGAARPAGSGGRVTAFSVWAPAAGRVSVEVAGRGHEMAPAGRSGWWQAELPVSGEIDYAFRLDGGEPLPDPRSPRQPYGPAGASRTYDHSAFAWSDSRWRGAPLAGAVIYELHVGTFTPSGTLDAAIERLDYLAGLGVTTVELMPLAAFPGQHGWGYDGIGLWAVHEPYGGPDALKRFVDACARARPRRLPRRRLQPRRPREPARRVRAVLHRGAHDAVGAGGQPGPGRARTRCARSSRATR